jgi:hypothetical protein
MIVKEPQTEFEVIIPPEDIEAIVNCIGVLEDILETMDKYNCDSLDYGYPDCPEYTKLGDIVKAKHLLSTFEEVHTML